MEEQEIKKDVYDICWEKSKNIALRTLSNLRPQNIEEPDRKKYLLSVPLNAYVVYLASQKLIFPWWMGATFIAGGYFFEKAVYQEFTKSDPQLEIQKNQESVDVFVDADIKSQLDIVLAEYGMGPQFVRASEDDFATHYRYILKTGNIKPVLSKRRDIEIKLALEINRLAISVEKNIFTFSVKKERQILYKLDEILLNTKRPANMELPFILGVDKKTSNVIIKDFPYLIHSLIVGATGSGKSCTFNSIIQSLMYWNDNVVFYFIDFKETELSQYENFTNSMFIEPDFESLLKGHKELIEEFERRKKLFREKGVKNIQAYNKLPKVEKLPYIILATDEANSYRDSLTNKQFEEINKLLCKSYSKFRTFGIHIVHVCQRIIDDLYCKTWRTQAKTKMCHFIDADDAETILRNREAEEKALVCQAGDFIYVHDGGKYIELRSPYIDNEIGKEEYNEVFRILERMYGGKNDEFCSNENEIEREIVCSLSKF